MEVELDKMYRAIHLSSMAYNATYPNPRVGAVLVHNGIVIGEGFHKKYGGLHAEEECINNVEEKNKKYISESTLYVTLEPCNHIGKRPACTDLILRQAIPKVVIASTDPNPIVEGTGIQKLRESGVEVVTGILEEEAISQNLYFHHFYTQDKTYIILKWAEDKNSMIGSHEGQVSISSPETNEFTMRWRAETQSILVGAQTAITDDPQLTNRSKLGIQPSRIVLDPDLRAWNTQPTLRIFSTPPSTYVFNSKKDIPEKNLLQLGYSNPFSVEEIIEKLTSLHILVAIIEGGATTLQRFIDANAFDEIRVIRSMKETKADIPAPKLPEGLEAREEILIHDDSISYYYA